MMKPRPSLSPLLIGLLASACTPPAPAPGGQVQGASPSNGYWGSARTVTVAGASFAPLLKQDLDTKSPMVAEPLGVLLDGKPVSTKFVSSTALDATLPAALDPGEHTLTVARGGTVLQGKATYTSRSPLAVQASGFADLGVGNSVTAHLTLGNDGDAAIKVAVSASASNTDLGVGLEAQTLSLDPGTTRTLEVPLTAYVAGEVTVTATATAFIPAGSLAPFSLAQTVHIGPAATSGSSGSTGTAGSTGSTGATSSTGSSGSTGTAGSTGSTGTTGSSGTTGIVDATGSWVQLNKTSATADGVASVTATVTVKDTAGNPIAGKMVRVSANPATGTGLPLTIGPTDASGMAAATFTSTKAGAKVVSATVDPSGAAVVLAQQPQVTFVPGPVSGTASMVSVSPSAGVTANGTTAATVTVTVTDAQGNPIFGKAVRIAGDISLGTNLPINIGPTDVSGLASGAITSTKAETVALTATVDPTGAASVLAARPTLQFVAGPLSASASTVVANPSTGIVADGVATSTLAVALADAQGNPIAGRPVQLSASGTSNVLSSPNPATTDASGNASWTLASAKAEQKTLTAIVDPAGTSPVTLAARPAVTFVAPTLPGWAQGASATTARKLLAVALGDNGDIAAIGGDVPTTTNTSDLYLPASNGWTPGVAMSGARDQLAAASDASGLIYAVGGNDGTGPLGLLAVYDVAAASANWTPEASMPTARRSLAAAVGSDGKLYAVGGDTGAGATAVIEAYTLSSNGWNLTPLTAMPTARKGLGAAADGAGKIYAVGGTDGTAVTGALQAYDIPGNSWSPLAAMPTPRANLAAVMGPDGRLYAIGGSDGTGPLATVEAYSPSTGRWSTVASLGTARDGLGAAVARDGRIAAIGGEIAGGTASPAVELYGPSISLTPANGAAGSAVSLSGSSFAASAAVKIYWGDPITGTLLASGTTGATGAVAPAISFTVPAAATAGTYKVTAVDAVSLYPVNATFTVN